MLLYLCQHFFQAVIRGTSSLSLSLPNNRKGRISMTEQLKVLPEILRRIEKCIHLEEFDVIIRKVSEFDVNKFPCITPTKFSIQSYLTSFFYVNKDGKLVSENLGWNEGFHTFQLLENLSSKEFPNKVAALLLQRKLEDSTIESHVNIIYWD